MEYEVNSNETVIDFGATGVTEVLQNIKMVLTTLRFTCPMNRDLTIDPDLLDGPINLVKARMTSFIAETLIKFEPRAELVKVNFEIDALEGKLKPIVRVRIDESTL